MPIDVLPDDVLLAIFDFWADEVCLSKREMEAWQILVHVCRRWRSVVFGSPHRLDLRLFFTIKTPARDTLDVWPALPLCVRCHGDTGDCPTESVDNIIAVLERSDRVYLIDMAIPSSYLEKVLAAVMQEPFPELASLALKLKPHDGTVTVLPDSFLGGSTPRLQYITFTRIPFPGLPKLLLSATHLVELTLFDIPHSGYFPPEAMVASLSALPELESFFLTFQSPRSRPDRASRRPPPRTRSFLFFLIEFMFEGVSEYLDDLVAGIYAPGIINLYITFFNQTVFDTPQFPQFISRTPTLEAPVQARINFGKRIIGVSLLTLFGAGDLDVKISSRELDWQLSSLEQFCTLSLPPLSALEELRIYVYEAPLFQPDSGWQDNVEETQWLELFNPFAAVTNLYICKDFVPCIVSALQELVGGRTMEVLPTLQNIFLEGLESSGPVRKGIEQFVAARRVARHSIAVSPWDPNMLIYGSDDL